MRINFQILIRILLDDFGENHYEVSKGVEFVLIKKLLFSELIQENQVASQQLLYEVV